MIVRYCFWRLLAHRFPALISKQLWVRIWGGQGYAVEQCDSGYTQALPIKHPLNTCQLWSEKILNLRMPLKCDH